MQEYLSRMPGVERNAQNQQEKDSNSVRACSECCEWDGARVSHSGVDIFLLQVRLSLSKTW